MLIGGDIKTYVDDYQVIQNVGVKAHDCGRKPENPEETHTDGENMQIPHRKDPGRPAGNLTQAPAIQKKKHSADQSQSKIQLASHRAVYCIIQLII